MATATASAALDLMTPGDIRRETGVELWAVRVVLDALGFARRIGQYRVIDRADLPLVVDELERRGYLDHGQGEGRPGASA